MSTDLATKVMKINKITPVKHKYFSVLDTIPKPPKNIFFIGSAPVERRPTIAIVGTRKPTAYGKEVAHTLAYNLSKYGVVIVSGLALGTDAIAHKGALEAGGVTLAVLANSVETIYPRSHQDLAERITANGGAILSEYEPPTEPRNYQFLARNRIVSGLSDAIIITEAALRSGTLSTATHALEQGAHPITCAEDALEVIAPHLLTTQLSIPLGSTEIESTIISHLQAGIRDGDELQRLSAIDAIQFTQALTMMELNGIIRPLGANQWALR